MSKNTPQLFDGYKSVNINSLPEAAWRVIQGDSDGDSGNKIERYRKAVGVLKRCIIIRQNGVRSVPWCVLDGGGKTLYESTESILPDNLKWLRSFRNLVGLTEASLILRSEAFWFKKMSMANTIYSLRWFSPLATKPIWTADGLTSFERKAKKNFEPEKYGAEEIIYHWIPDPMEETKPDSPVAVAAMAAANVLFNVDVFASTFFERGAIKATLLTVEGNLAPQEKSRLKEWWNRFYRGVRNAGAAEVVNANVKPVIVGEGLSELADTTLTGERREEIATTLGIPHSMVFSNASNFATAQQDEQNFYNGTILPECDIISEALNEQLFDGLDLQFQFQPEKMDLFQEDEQNRAKSLLDYVNAGMKLSIAASILGVELPNEMEYADLDSEPVVVQVQPIQNNQNDNQQQDNQQNNDQRPVTPAQVKALRKVDLEKWQRKAQKRIDSGKSALCDFESDWLSTLEVQLIKSKLDVIYSKSALNVVFEQAVGGGLPENFFTLPACWAGKTIPDFETSVKALTLQLDPDDDEAEQKLRMAIERQAIDDLEKALEKQRRDLLAKSPTSALEVSSRVTETSGSTTDALRRALIASTDLGVAVSVKQFENIGIGFDWTLAHADARDWANQYTGQLITQINDTTRRHVQQAVSQWITNGDPLPVLIKQLEATFGQRRAELIAVTEVTKAYAEGTVKGYKAAGYGETEPKQIPPAHPKCRCRVALHINQNGSAYYIWLTAFDELVCPQCSALANSNQGIAKSEGPKLPAITLVIEPVAAYNLDEGRIVREALNNALGDLYTTESNLENSVEKLRLLIDDTITAYNKAIPGTSNEERLKLWTEMNDVTSKARKEHTKLLSELEKARKATRKEALKVLTLPETKQASISLEEDASFSGRRGVAALRKRQTEAIEFVNKVVASDVNSVDVYFIKGRAAASGGNIYIGSKSNVSTIVHEIGHTIEHNRGEIYRNKRLAFFNDRTKEDKLEQLKTLFPNSGYRWGEATKKDQWVDAYTGKVYPSDTKNKSASEIVSMGIQQLYDSPGKFINTDPQFFDFIVSYLRGSI